jgi:hypothetical protein
MWYLIAGYSMSFVVNLVFSKVLKDKPNLSISERFLGWFFIEYAFERYNQTPGKLFLINEDFRRLVKNVIIALRNIFFFSNLLTFTEFFLYGLLPLALIYLIFFFIKVASVKNQTFKVVIIIYYTLITNILILKLYFQFSLFDLWFIGSVCLAAIILFINFYFIYVCSVVILNIVNFDKVWCKLAFYSCFTLIICCCLLNELVKSNLHNNNFVQEFVLKNLIVYVFLYYK